MFLYSGKYFFRFLDVFWILGSVLDPGPGSVFGLWDMFWILESVLSLRATIT